MIPKLAAKKLLMSVSETVVDCDVRSDRVLAIIVTLRSTATPDENSTVPKNSTSMSGTITANSVAATADESFCSRAAANRIRTQTLEIDILIIVVRPSVRLILERHRRGQQSL